MARAHQNLSFLVPDPADSPDPALFLNLGLLWVQVHLLKGRIQRHAVERHEPRLLEHLPEEILFYCLVDTLFFPAFYHATDAKTERDAYLTATSRVIRAYNRNGLALFLLANLLTGLVNMTVPTLHVGPVATMAILIAYSGTLTAVAVALDSYDVFIKL
ncbi:GPI-anchored wall transfer protein 1 like [Verticillium longisporum]|nr:GPI-anchored wall transfer protein 1 like [Verticillium longisporum]